MSARPLLALLLLAVPLVAQETVEDGWSGPITWRTSDGWYAVAVHATLLPDGRVHFMGFERDAEDPDLATATRRSAFVMTPTPLGEGLPAEVTVDSLAEPVEFDEAIFGNLFVNDDLFCAGNSITADGSVFTVGGTRAFYDLTTLELGVLGIPTATVFDGTSWDRVAAPMLVEGAFGNVGRWYPSATRLRDGRMLVTSGYEMVYPVPTPNISVEAFDPGTRTWEVLSTRGETPPEVFNSDYTHPFVLPRPVGPYDVMMFGEAGVPVLFSTTSEPRWILRQTRPGTVPGTAPNKGASTTLLPIRVRDGEWGYGNGSALVTSGDHGTSHMPMLDVYDPQADGWQPSIDTQVMRHHPSTVLLPDGRVLRVSGHAMVHHDGLERAGYVDPRRGFEHRLGSSLMGRVRGYHNVAVLLPDGRVLVGGGRDLDTATTAEKSSFQYLYPPYMFGPRPVLHYAPERLRYGKGFPIVTTGGKIREVVLVGLTSMTHSMDFNQRHVQLRFARHQVPLVGDPGLRWVEAPANRRVAPPGPYLLFALDGQRRPSHAAIVQLR